MSLHNAENPLFGKYYLFLLTAIILAAACRPLESQLQSDNVIDYQIRGDGRSESVYISHVLFYLTYDDSTGEISLTKYPLG